MYLSLGCLFWLFVCVVVFLGYRMAKSTDSLPSSLRNLYFWGKLQLKDDAPRLLLFFTRIPKRCFSHFYLSGLIFNSIFIYRFWTKHALAEPYPEWMNQLLGLICYPMRPGQGEVPIGTVAVVMMLMEVHLLRRLWECWYMSVYSESYMSIAHYSAGLVFYSFLSISVMSEVKLQHGLVLEPNNQSKLVCNLYKIAGFLLFAWAGFEQNRVNNTFAELRSSKQDMKHYIPRGGWFELISCPHFFTEILTYVALCILTAFQCRVLISMTLFVIVNQVFAGLLTHQWYQDKFPAYPQNRKAIIPYIL